MAKASLAGKQQEEGANATNALLALLALGGGPQDDRGVPQGIPFFGADFTRTDEFEEPSFGLGDLLPLVDNFLLGGGLQTVFGAPTIQDLLGIPGGSGPRSDADIAAWLRDLLRGGIRDPNADPNVPAGVIVNFDPFGAGASLQHISSNIPGGFAGEAGGIGSDNAFRDFNPGFPAGGFDPFDPFGLGNPGFAGGV